ncbi:MAG: metal-dependent hydrolase [Candidatus Methanoperedens sp.]|nr:metal-dependent hydrolase [Candidatus Methanoperedens sp.]
MLFEHLIYSTAIAIIAGMLWFKRTGRDPSWIIIVSAFAPDFDIFAGELFKKLDMIILINGAPIRHGDFHNIAFLLLFASAVALILRFAGMKFKDSFLFAGIGFGAHMFEDALVYNPAYSFFYPLSKLRFGIGIIDYIPGFYGIANIDILILGIVAMVLCVGIRTAYESNGGVKRIARTLGVAAAVMILMVPVFVALDIKVLEKVNSIAEIGYIDKWKFTPNASWDSTVFHSGLHSARIEVQGNESRRSGRWISEKIVVKPNSTYIFSAWGNTEGAGGNSQPVVRIVELNASGKSINQTRILFSKGNNDWTRKQAIFKTRPNTSRVYVYAIISKGFGTFWLDDVELYEEKSENNMIINGGFEEEVKSILIPNSQLEESKE